MQRRRADPPPRRPVRGAPRAGARSSMGRRGAPRHEEQQGAARGEAAARGVYDIRRAELPCLREHGRAAEHPCHREHGRAAELPCPREHGRTADPMPPPLLPSILSPRHAPSLLAAAPYAGRRQTVVERAKQTRGGSSGGSRSSTAEEAGSDDNGGAPSRSGPLLDLRHRVLSACTRARRRRTVCLGEQGTWRRPWPPDPCKSSSSRAPGS
jgi:hypothetical protein